MLSSNIIYGNLLPPLLYQHSSVVRIISQRRKYLLFTLNWALIISIHQKHECTILLDFSLPIWLESKCLMSWAHNILIYKSLHKSLNPSIVTWGKRAVFTRHLGLCGYMLLYFHITHFSVNDVASVCVFSMILIKSSPQQWPLSPKIILHEPFFTLKFLQQC